jgi:enoyl-CoA hydratase/carnithine racemase
MERVRKLARQPPISLRLAKESILAGLERPGKGYDVEAENFGRAAMTEDAMIGIMSFMAKQEPDFKGK